MPFPFENQRFTFTQPDGTKLEVFGTGDQHHAVFETLDGYTIVRDPDTGFYQYATISQGGDELVPTGARVDAFDASALNLTPRVRINAEAARARAEENFRRMTSSMRCEQRRQRKKELARAASLSRGIFLAPPDRGTSGNIVGICVLVDFPDDEATITQQQVDDFSNLRGYSEFGNNGSVLDYFDDNSMGKLQYTNVVTTYYRAIHPKTYYTNPNINYGTRAMQLIKEALDHLRNQGFAFDQLTADSDGYVYAMNIFYAGFNQNNWSEGLWPHAWNLAAPYNIGSGRKLYDYQFTDMTDTLELGTFCHENGHMVCDFPDLYDKSGFRSRGAGRYCAMSGGGHGTNPGQISAYLKYKAGWSSTLTPITHGAEISLSSEQNDFAIFKKSETEYFILENRNQTGRDAALPSAGLTIWHVEEFGNNSNEQRTPDLHFELSLEQADNKFELERGVNGGNAGDLYHAGGPDEFSNDTGPNSKWWDRTLSELKVHDIGAVGTTIKFKTSLREGTNDSGVYKASSQPNLSIPDKNAVGIADSISFNDDVVISSIKVTVDITHSYRGDLRVTLHTPWATSLVLHQRHQGGSDDDIKVTYDMLTAPVLNSVLGQSLKGEWSLHVQDLAAEDLGVLNSWELEAESAVRKEVELEESPGTKIPDDDPAGIERTLTTGTTGTVGAVEVSVDITHSYIRDLIVSLRSPKGTLVHLHQRTGGSADDVVNTYTEASTPGLSAFHGEAIEGDWTLRVSDHEGEDKGKVNHWRVKITGQGHPAAAKAVVRKLKKAKLNVAALSRQTKGVTTH